MPEVGTLIKDRGYRQVWRFEHDGEAYFLKFYPRGGYRDQFRRVFRGSPAMREFLRLQWLQRAQVPAPRATAVMMGFSLKGERGDVVILEAIEPSVQLDQYLLEAGLRGEDAPDHLSLAKQIRDIVAQLIRSKLGHQDLHLGNFLLQNGKLFLLDAYAVRAGGMRERDLLMLGHGARRFATRTDLQRGWNQLSTGGRMPEMNSISQWLWRRFLDSAAGRKSRYFGELESDGWRGLYCRRSRYPHRWSRASRLEFFEEDWLREWPRLKQDMLDDRLEVLKRSRSGDVLAAKVTLGGETLDVIVKRPRRRYWYRYLNEIGRGSRPWRAWLKAWQMIVRELPVAWPLLIMEQRQLGYVTDAVLVSERVPGSTLAHADLDAIAGPGRDTLLRRTGRILRAIERFGYSHFDAKASNWIVLEDDKVGPTPVMVDVDGIRRRNWVALGIRRLLRSMHENPHYAQADSLSLCRGYAPYAPLGEIAAEPAPVTES